MQTYVQLVGGPHVWSAPHVSICVFELHWVAPVVQAPAQLPPLQIAAQGGPSSCHMPPSLHRCGVLSLHCLVPGVQTPPHAPAAHT